MRLIVRLILVITITGVALAGCSFGPTYLPLDLSGYYWPKEPQPARLRLLNVIRHDLDLRETTPEENLFGGQAYFRFTKPHSIVVDVNENIYVTDSYARTVYVLNIEKASIKQLSKPGGWRQPMGLGIDNVNHIIAVTDSNRVLLIDYLTNKVLLTLGSKERFVRPQGLALDPVNRFLYIGDTKASKIYKYDYDGNRLAVIASRGSGPKGVYYPGNIALDKRGRLYVVDTMNWKVKIFDSSGKPIRSFGTHGSLPGQFNRPKGISVSKDGILAITDNDLNIFLLMDEFGNTYTYMGGMGSSPAQFIVPQGIYVSENDKIYVVDQINRRIQVFQMYTDKYYKEHPEALLPKKPAGEPTTNTATEAPAKATPQ